MSSCRIGSPTGAPLEPRERWQRRSPCAKPRTLVAGKPGDQFTFIVNDHAGRSHLPVVSLQRAA